MRARVMVGYIHKPNSSILASKELTDMEKFCLLFDKDKESIKNRYPELYYTALGIIDREKKPMITPRCNLARLLEVEDDQVFTVNGYYYKVVRQTLMVDTIHGYNRCDHSEVACVVAKRDEIKILE